MKINRELPPILLLVMIAALYLGSFTNGFTWHDKAVIKDIATLSLRDLSSVIISTTPAPDVPEPEKNVYQYRPVTRIALFLDQKILGTNPLWHHMEAALLHYLTVLLFYNIVLISFKDIRAALYSSMLFALHPLAVEPVNSVMARDGMLCTMFLMASLSFLLQMRGKRKKRLRLGAYALIAFALGTLSLEIGAVFALFLVAMAFLGRDDSLRGSVLSVTAFLLAAAAYFGLRMALHGNGAFPGVMGAEAWGLGASGGSLPGLFSKYLGLIAFPFSLGVGYSPAQVDSSLLRGIIVTASTACLLIATLLPKTPQPVRAACIWILVFFLPFTYTIPFAGLPLSDRYAYLAAPGICLLYGWGASALSVRNPYFSTLILAALLVAMGVATYRQNIVWKNDFTLWGNAVKISPTSVYANYNYGRIHDEIDANTMAITYYEKALAEYPEYDAPHIGLGHIYARTNRHRQAADHYKMALTYAPQKTWLRLDRGDVFMKMENWDKAIASYARHLKQNPEDPEAHHRIAVAYQSKGDYTRALEHFREALSSRPRSAKTRYDFSRLLLEINDVQNARFELKLALLIKPDYSEARKLLNMITP